MSLGSGEKRGEAAPHNLCRSHGKTSKANRHWACKSELLFWSERSTSGFEGCVNCERWCSRYLWKQFVFPIKRHALFSLPGAQEVLIDPGTPSLCFVSFGCVCLSLSACFSVGEWTVTMSAGRSVGHSDLSRFKSELFNPDCCLVPVDGARLLYAVCGGAPAPLAWLRGWPARVPARRFECTGMPVQLIHRNDCALTCGPCSSQHAFVFPVCALSTERNGAFFFFQSPVCLFPLHTSCD